MSFLSKTKQRGIAHERRQGRACDLSFEARGSLAPFFEVSLLPGEGLVCDHSAILQFDDGLIMKGWPGLAGTRRLIVNANAEAEASLMLSTAAPGFSGAFDLADYGGRLICAGQALMAAGPGVSASFYARIENLGVSLVLLEGNGWVFLRSRGDAYEHRLRAGEKVSVRTHSVAAMTATVDMEITGNKATASGEIATPDFCVLTGPGTIWLQSIYDGQTARPPLKAMPERQHVREMQTGGLAFLTATNA